MSWDPPSPIDSMWEAITSVNERLDKIIAILKIFADKETET